ncbi:MAG: hypothetical protein CL927_02480 [Deltaproteobacteria bacterium]|nr:hypothetical protein [Deltaproteobacteria bacterium]HCH66318.1 hypothetical protein [Deltaproteobacteria bacterium]
MLVVFGANGRTGREIVRQANERGWAVRPVVRDDRDGRGLDRIVDVGAICYADPDHPESLAPILEGATHVVSCINARSAGPGCPRYNDEAGAHIVRAAHAAGVEKMLHLSVVGSFRWSPNPLNRRSFRLDRHVRVLKDVPWTMIRMSCYFDEIIEAHVRPPDGRRPHRIVRSGRYSPISRRDAARMVVDLMPRLVPNRTLYVGGPTVYTGESLDALVGPWREDGSGFWRTSSGALPPGDVSVSPDTTRVMVDTVALDHFEDALDPNWEPTPFPTERNAPAASINPPSPASGVTDASMAPEPATAADSPAVPPPPGSVDPGPHPIDEGRTLKTIATWGSILRRVVHSQLADDLARLGIDAEGGTLDFRAARKRKGGRSCDVHEGTFTELTGVRFHNSDGKQAHRATATFLYDKLADVFHIWFERPDRTIPDAIWNQLDMGVQRRLAEEPFFAGDPKVEAFQQGGAQQQLD